MGSCSVWNSKVKTVTWNVAHLKRTVLHGLWKYCPVMLLISVIAVTSLKVLVRLGTEVSLCHVSVKAVNPEFMASRTHSPIQIGTHALILGSLSSLTPFCTEQESGELDLPFPEGGG